MDIDNIITTLQAFKKKYGGDTLIKVSSDEEGNMISDIFEIKLVIDEDQKTKEIVIFPNQ